MLVQASERLKNSRKKIKHLKFPLYADSEIGFDKLLDGNLVENSADEDYATDSGILQRTIAVCKRDCLFALKTMHNAPKTYQLSLHNNLY